MLETRRRRVSWGLEKGDSVIPSDRMFLALSTSKHDTVSSPRYLPTTSRVVRTSVLRLCYFPRGTLHIHTSRIHFVFLEKTRRQHISSDRAEKMFVPWNSSAWLQPSPSRTRRYLTLKDACISTLRVRIKKYFRVDKFVFPTRFTQVARYMILGTKRR